MIEPRLLLCSGAERPATTDGRRIVELDALGDSPNVNIRIGDVARVFQRNLGERAVDLLELAAYVFTADAGTRRGTQWEDDAREPWDRDLKLVIPVRDLEFWQREDVSSTLVRTLTFLTDDHWSFDFVPLTRGRPTQEYLELGNEDWPFRDINRVVMFSGGLDSLAGAVQEATAGHKLVLVSHRPVATISSRQRSLFNALRTHFSEVPMLHVPVWINKANRFGHEPSQRTRSFLFTALGTVVGQLIGASGMRFYENGIVSLNLPVADEVVRARASRTTHPLALQYLQRFASLVVEQPFVVENPFLYHTKADVVRSIEDNGAGHLIGLSVSCAHTVFKSKGQQHCGTCSQCIDRRVNVLAANLADRDLCFDYVSDVFTGPRKEGYEQNIAIHYARHATELVRMSDEQFAARFQLEISRAVRSEPNASEAAQRLYDLHQRHAEGVLRVLTEQMQINAPALVSRTLDGSSMLGLVGRQQHEQPLWDAYAQRLGDLLEAGLPRAIIYLTHPTRRIRLVAGDGTNHADGKNGQHQRRPRNPARSGPVLRG